MSRHDAASAMSTLHRCGGSGRHIALALLIIYVSSAHALLEWVIKPGNRSLAIGQDLILPCQVFSINESDPMVTVTYKWTFNGTKVQDKAAKFSNNSLFVPGFNDSDAGVYTCLGSRIKNDLSGSVLESLTASALVIKAFLDPFVLQPTSVAASLGETVTLTCVTGRSSPNVQVKWLRNGKVYLNGIQRFATFGGIDESGLSEQLSMKLTILTSEADYGVYVCQAYNDLLSKTVLSSEANLTYVAVPSDDIATINWKLPDQLVVPEGHDLILPCQTQPTTEIPQISWYYDNSAPKISSRVYILSNNSLGFFPYLADDDGNYSCTAANSAGVSLSPTVTIQAAYLRINFKSQPTNTTAFMGSNVTLTCDPPDSLPFADVVWYKDYAPLNVGSKRIQILNHNLNLVSVTLSDRGLYYCVAYNNLTSPSFRTSLTAKLTVQGPPLIKVPPLNAKVIKDQPLQLTCQTEANPLPVTFWQFEGMNLTDNNFISILNQGQDLWINKIGKEWQGLFSCVASNMFGKISADAYVTVVAQPVSLQMIGQIVTKVGDSVDIPCYVVADPPPTILWLFNKATPLNKSVELSWSDSSPALHIQYVTSQQAGTYSCLGYNEAGNASSSGSLVVNAAPTLSVPLQNSSVVIQQYITLTCEFKGQPTPSEFWLFNSSTILPTNVQMNGVNSSLTIGPVSWENQGTYTCTGQNVIGQTSSSAFISLLVPPQITSFVFPQSLIKLLSKFVLTCSASGIPQPTIQWLFEGQPVQSSSDGRVQVSNVGVLTVQFAQKGDSGQYKCLANSSMGQVDMTATINIYGPPSAPVLLSATALSFESVALTWNRTNLSENINNFQLFFKERISEELTTYPTLYSDGQMSGTVSGLKPYTAYVFYVSAVNDAGVSDRSNPLKAVTNQSSPFPPANFLISTITSTAASLTWEVPIVSNGVIRLYQLKYKADNSQSDFITVNVTATQIPSVEVSISPLLPYTQYIAQVRAANIENGIELWGNFTSAITFLTSPSRPLLPPQSVQAVAADPYSIKITWKPIPDGSQNGPILYYNVTCFSTAVEPTKFFIVKSNFTEKFIFGLHPWQLYTIQLCGVNEVGAGPMSEAIVVRTLPIGPVYTPTNVAVFVNSSTLVTVTWMPIAVSLQTCNITTYYIQYREQGKSIWLQYFISPSSSSSSGLLWSQLDYLNPWTWYEMRLAAVCDNITSGIGPFTYPVAVQTLQGVSSPVTEVNLTAEFDGVWLSWQPPSEVHGVLTGYQVTVHLADGSNSSKDTRAVITQSTNIRITGLQPETSYNINIVAVNGAGTGEPTILQVTTSLLPTTSVAAEATRPTYEQRTLVTYETSNVTGYALTQHSDLPIKQNLAAIVAGSIVGAIALIIITVFVCIKCMNYRKKQRMNYAVDGESENGEPVSAYRSLESANSPPPTFSPSFAVTNHSVSKSSPQSVASSLPTSPSSALIETPDTTSHFNNNNFSVEKHKQKAHLSLPHISVSNAYLKLEDELSETTSQVSEHQGYDNPGFNSSFTKEKTNPSFLNIPSTSGISFDATSVISETLRRKHRMRNETAAAIAYMKSHQDVPVDDTDILVDNEIESEVIYNERTVL